MTKKQMKETLIKRIKKELSGLELLDTLALLNQFEKVFEIKKYAEKTKGIKKYYYYGIGYAVAIDGFVRDIRVNSKTGKKLFGKIATFGTLTSTLVKVKEQGPKAQNYALAVEICAVLSNYDKGHC